VLPSCSLNLFDRWLNLSAIIAESRDFFGTSFDSFFFSEAGGVISTGIISFNFSSTGGFILADITGALSSSGNRFCCSD
jgi:hypothetical protein